MHVKNFDSNTIVTVFHTKSWTAAASSGNARMENSNNFQHF